MRLYGKRFLRNSMQAKVRARSETRDALLWEVLPLQRMARVRIQGSDNLITAYYPLSWDVTPPWLKPGNAVRICHVGGNRGRVELVGCGQLLPTSMGAQAEPTIDVFDNAVLSGLKVKPTTPPSLQVHVTSGRYRINGEVLEVAAEAEMVLGDPVTMAADSTDILGDSLDIAATIQFDPTPTPGSWRYDYIFLGADGVFDYAAGPVFTIETGPQYVATPADHVVVERVLVHGAGQVIDSTNVGQYWQVPLPVTFGVVNYEFSPDIAPLSFGFLAQMAPYEYLFEIPVLPPGSPPPYSEVTLQVKDQFGYVYHPQQDEVVEIWLDNAPEDWAGSPNDPDVYGHIEVREPLPFRADPRKIRTTIKKGQAATLVIRWYHTPAGGDPGHHSPRLAWTLPGWEGVSGQTVIWFGYTVVVGEGEEATTQWAVYLP